MNVGFLVVGAQKSGTSALDKYLRMHPSLCMAETKEVHFFDSSENFEGGDINIDYYHSFFRPKANQILGEVTPIYMYWDDAPYRIWQYNPAMKVIAVLRNPVERAFSHWNMEAQRGADTLAFQDAIAQESERCRAALPEQHRVYSYVDRGYYLLQLRRLWQLFGEKQVLVIRYEELRDNPTLALGNVCEFLDISPFVGVPSIKEHVIKYRAQMGNNEKTYLQELFRHEIHGLETALGWDCSDWLS